MLPHEGVRVYFAGPLDANHLSHRSYCYGTVSKLKKLKNVYFSRKSTGIARHVWNVLGVPTANYKGAAMRLPRNPIQALLIPLKLRTMVSALGFLGIYCDLPTVVI